MMAAPRCVPAGGVSWNAGVHGTSSGLDFIPVLQGMSKRVLECRMELRGEHEDACHMLVLRNKVYWGALRVTSYCCV